MATHRNPHLPRRPPRFHEMGHSWGHVRQFVGGLRTSAGTCRKRVKRGERSSGTRVWRCICNRLFSWDSGQRGSTEIRKWSSNGTKATKTFRERRHGECDSFRPDALSPRLVLGGRSLFRRLCCAIVLLAAIHRWQRTKDSVPK